MIYQVSNFVPFDCNTKYCHVLEQSLHFGEEISPNLAFAGVLVIMINSI